MSAPALAREIRMVFDHKFGKTCSSMFQLIEPSSDEKVTPLKVPRGEFADWSYVMFAPHYTPDLCQWAQTAMDLLLYLKRFDPHALNTRINSVGGHHPRWTENTYGKSALHYAVSNGFPSLVSALLSVQGVDVNIKDYLGRTPLNEALVGDYNIQIVIELVRAGADFGVPDEEGFTPLHMTILFRRGDWLPMLVIDRIHGYNYHNRDKSGRTLLEWDQK